MLKSLHLKNWRSIREATIEFSPITVLIGANASGKTNVLDALYFLRDMTRKDITQAVYSRGSAEKIRNLEAKASDTIVIEYSFFIEAFETVIDSLTLKLPFKANRVLKYNKNLTMEAEYGLYHYDPFIQWRPSPEDDDERYSVLKTVEEFLGIRWQLLGENFIPPLTRSLSNAGDLYTIEANSGNTIFILDFMKETRPDLYESLQEDLRFLLGHVKHIASKRDEREVQIAFHENKHPDQEAPTVSAGTARILAVLAAIYALDMRIPKWPGLVVIEEPETSLNPSLLRKFVELLRGYTEDAEKPRQFILTTHNPSFLNYFEPEEVRVVSRDDDGNTVVNPVPDYVREIWLPEHDLGDAWLTNVFGGIAE